MKGHKLALCQLRSPSEESAHRYDGDDGCSTSPPYSPMIMDNRVSRYPHKPISPEPSWEVPPEGVFFHRRNPHISNPLLKVGLPGPLHRTVSWATTEKADDDSDAEDDGGPTPTQSFSTVSSLPQTQRQRQRRSFTAAVSNNNRSGINGQLSGTLPTPPTTPPGTQNAENSDLASGQKNKVDIVDGAGNRVLLGVDLSSLGENLKAILHQADQSGFHATVVRPCLGYNRGSVDIRTNADADKHTTIFVSTSPDTMSINLMCSEAFRKAKLVVNDEVVGRPWSMSGGGGNVVFWIVVFLVVFLASLVAAWVNNGVGRLFL